MWIIFEGLDKVGKTTLEWALHKRTNFKHIVIDRGPIGYLVFDKIFKREEANREQDFIQKAKDIMKTKDFLIVYCEASYDIVLKRLKEHNEICPYNYIEAQKIYLNNIRKFYDKEMTLELDTSFLNIDECIDLIIKKIKEVS